MDAFLKPLMDEITSLYINGIDIHLDRHIPIGETVITAGYHKVRALILMGTADLKAHAEISLYAGGGRIGCRRCLIHGVYIPCKRHYYYGKFRERYRAPCPLRTATYHLEHGVLVDGALTAAARQLLVTSSGVCGLSILFVLYRLYGFDPVKDMVIDRMHLTFNMIKREFLEKMWKDMGDNATLPVNERDPQSGGLLNRADFSAALEAVNWTTEEKAKGVARLKSLTDKLGAWKSNEFKRFSSVAREVLAEKIPSKAYDCFMLLCDAVKMLYNRKLQLAGWTNDDIEKLRRLLWAHAVKCEEYYGLEYCTENLECSVHAADEIHRHSSMDNYSCELYERAILRHKLQKHNAKGIEKTFATREALGNFLEDYEEVNGMISSYGEGNQKYRFSMDEAAPFYLHESSFASSKLLLEDLKGHVDEYKAHASSYGVGIGKTKRSAFQQHIIVDIKRFFARQGIETDIPNILKTVKSLAFTDEFGEVERISEGTACKIATNNNGEEWTMQVSTIILVGPIQDKYFYFVNGDYIVPLVEDNSQVLHEWCQSPKVIPRAYRRDSVQPSNLIKRKVILYPEPSNIANPAYWLIIDNKTIKVLKDVSVPVYPREGEIVQTLGADNQMWYGQVEVVLPNENEARVVWLKDTQRPGVWVPTRQSDTVHFGSMIRICQVKRVFGGISIE
ncbi:uncharacterized protein LOC125557470 [Nematostella vectensis]|uniref:uncharacterized protein LOC125557470 n=1 Tax=Nematostella vectensis TaxID=45351 RepID=UPI0020772CCD|nr:uncharacterized protein LOC125557470 [Nematostella vectensis]